MSYVSSIVSKRSSPVAARFIASLGVRPLTPPSSQPTSLHRYWQHRSMVVITHTMTNVDTQSSTNILSDASPIQTSPKEPIVSINPSSQTQSVIVTEACYKRIHHLISLKQQEDLYLRVFVDAGGCSGFTYQFELDSEENLKPDDDIIFTEATVSSSDNKNGQAPARVVVDKGSLQLIAGSKIDYVQEMIKSSFEVRENPQSESACGCGSSFALKNFASNPALD